MLFTFRKAFIEIARRLGQSGINIIFNKRFTHLKKKGFVVCVVYSLLSNIFCSVITCHSLDLNHQDKPGNWLRNNERISQVNFFGGGIKHD